MRRCSKSVICAVLLALFCSIAYGRTLTFDDIPAGTPLGDSFYYYDYRVSFGLFFQPTDHWGSTWGPPHSGSNVLTWTSSDFQSYPQIAFGSFPPDHVETDNIRSVSAYFSTQADIMVKVSAYRFTEPNVKTFVISTTIGALGQSWNNQLVEIGSPNGSFNMLEFEGVNSVDELLGFCADDMTITYVPEPSSILALLTGLAGIGGAALKRRKT